MDQGEVFRITAIDVRGKTALIVEENFGLPVDEFPNFLAEAETLLGSLRFSR